MGESKSYGGGDGVAVRVKRTTSKSLWAFSSANAVVTSLSSAFKPSFGTDQEKSCLRMNLEQEERVFLTPVLK